MELKQCLVILACLAFLLACIIIPARLGLVRGREDDAPCHGDCASCGARHAADVDAARGGSGRTIPAMTAADNHGRGPLPPRPRT